MLSEVKQRKKRYSNQIERVQANRTNKAKYQAKYRLRKKEEQAKEQQNFTGKSYRTDIYESIKDLDFGHKCTLRFNKFTSIEYATAATKYLLKRLNAGISNVTYTPEHGEDRNVHIHLAFQFSKEFLNLYPTRKQLTEYIHSIHNDKIKNGSVWIKRLRSNKRKQNYLYYMFKQVLPLSKFHYRQKQVDLWYVQSFINVTTGFDNYVTTRNTIPTKANISPKNDYINLTSKHTPDTKIMPHKPLKILISKYKHQVFSVTIAAIWLLLL